MAVPTSAEFLVQYPEYATLASDAAGLALVNAKLAIAIRRYDEEAAAPFYSDLVLRKTAQLLALSPFGLTARLVNKQGETVYDAYIEEMELSVSFGNRVV